MSIPASNSSSALDLPVDFFFRFVRTFPPIVELGLLEPAVVLFVLCLLEAWAELTGVILWEDDVIVTPEGLLERGVLGVSRVEFSEVRLVVKWWGGALLGGLGGVGIFRAVENEMEERRCPAGERGAVQWRLGREV